MQNYDIMAAYLVKMKMQGRKKVYVETSVVSNLTAQRSLNIVDLARQVATQQWWDEAVTSYELFSSVLVEREAQRGDADAAARRMEAVDRLEKLPIIPEAENLAEKLLEATAVPRTSYEDAVHIAIAAVNGMDFLVTWNCRHIANAETMPKIYETCRVNGFVCPLICTPEQLMKEV